jgi:tetratricopeptide (TPR) repeat protein
MFKKIIHILIFSLIFSVNPVFAEENGYLEYNIYGYEFKNGDNVKFLKNADRNIKLWEISTTEADKKFYLQEALRYYYLLSIMEKNSINAHIGLGKVFDEMNLDKYAQEHFYKAYNINKNNADLNLKFADYYYKRKDFIKALKHYKLANQHGLSGSEHVNRRIAILYEKLADIDKSKEFYSRTLRFDPKNKDLKKKIHSLDDLNYSETQYYLFIK